MATHEQRPCPVCKLDQQNVELLDYEKCFALKCDRRGGKFTITETAAKKAESKDISYKLSAWIRERTESGTEIKKINAKTLEDIEMSFPNYRVSEKQLILMRACERRTEFPGYTFKINLEHDYPLAWATGAEEFNYLLESLADRGLIRLGQITDVIPSGDPVELVLWGYEVAITAAGWSFLDEHARTSVISNQAFVAMSFHEDLKPAFRTGIEPAIKKAGFNAYRTDMEPHNDRIDLKIMTEIKNSRFLVADVTQQRPGVYFEAGYAIGLGLPVFWCVRYDDLEKVHFDTRQYNHIVWDDEQHLEEQLHVFVTAIVGKGSAQ
jgi:nucleoside 2-deoxyribosyltransferase